LLFAPWLSQASGWVLGDRSGSRCTPFWETNRFKRTESPPVGIDDLPEGF